MSLKWRCCLLVLIAAAAFGIFIPNGHSSAAPQPSGTPYLLAEEVPFGPLTCYDAACSKGAPIPTTPPMSVAAASVLFAGVLTYALTRGTRRIRPHVVALPRGHLAVPFRPPQLSSF